jgi:hypothetical protein
MKTGFLLLILLLGLQRLVGQHDILYLSGNGYSYSIVTQTQSNEWGSKDTLVKMYRLENGVKKYLLTHYLYRYSADCNNTFTDIGTIEYFKDRVIFDTQYIQKGSDPIPEAQKQIYNIDNRGRLLLVSDKVYMNGKWVNTGEMPQIAPY